MEAGVGHSILSANQLFCQHGDGAAEILALRLQPTDKVLCVTASGARTLDLLTDPLAVVHSVDISPPQSYLLQLKMAAYQHLTYEEFRSFVAWIVRLSDTGC